MTDRSPIDIPARLAGRLGCSEIAVALGLSPFKTPYQLWLEKTGRLEPEVPSLAARLGVPMEPIIRSLYEERTGRKLRRDRRERIHPELPLIGHLDYVEVGGEGRIVDCKSSFGFHSRRRYGEDGTDQLPDEYLCQGQAYLFLTRKPVIDFAVLTSGPEFKIFTVRADPDMHRLIAEGVRRFWQFVRDDIPPALSTAEDAALAWPESVPEKTVTATETLEQMVQRLRDLRDEIAAKTEMAEAAATLLKSRMGDAEVLLSLSGEKLCSWKTTTVRRIDTARLRTERPELFQDFVKETRNRVFRITDRITAKSIPT